MVDPKVSRKIIQADRLIDGRGGAAMDNMSVIIVGSQIVEVVPQGQLSLSEAEAYERFEFPNATPASRSDRLPHSHQYASERSPGRRRDSRRRRYKAPAIGPQREHSPEVRCDYPLRLRRMEPNGILFKGSNATRAS